MSQPPLTVFYSPAYAVDGKMETVSKSKLVAGLIESGAAGEVWLEAPKPATRRELELIHEAEYVRHTLEDKGAFLEVGPWSQPLLDSILASTGGMRDAVKEALKNGRSGSLSSGLHHARRNSGNGFCQFNGLALAALEALKKAAKDGVVVVRSTRLPMGLTLRNNEVNDDEMGFVASGELNPPKSRVLLQLALTKTSDPKRIQAMFYEY